MSDVRKKSHNASGERQRDEAEDVVERGGAGAQATENVVTNPPDYELAATVRADTPAQLKALGDPLRTSILHLVLERAATTTELAAALVRPKGTIDHHLKVLEAAGLMRVVRTRKVRAMTERYWGRTGRTIVIASAGDGDDKAAFFADARDRFRSGAHDYITLRYARLAPDRVAEFAHRLDQLATEFVATPRGGTVVHGLLLALAATDEPALGDPRADDD